MKPQKILLVIFFALLTSCVSDVDFDQIDDIEIENSLLFSVVHFKANTDKFMDEMGNEQLFISDTTELPIFGWSHNDNYLVKVDFQFKVSNTFDREIIIQFETLDEENVSTFHFPSFIIGANNAIFENEQTVLEVDIPKVILTNKVVVSVLLDSGSNPLDSLQNMDIKFMSAVQFHYQITANEE